MAIHSRFVNTTIRQSPYLYPYVANVLFIARVHGHRCKLAGPVLGFPARDISDHLETTFARDLPRYPKHCGRSESLCLLNDSIPPSDKSRTGFGERLALPTAAQHEHDESRAGDRFAFDRLPVVMVEGNVNLKAFLGDMREKLAILHPSLAEIGNVFDRMTIDFGERVQHFRQGRGKVLVDENLQCFLVFASNSSARLSAARETPKIRATRASLPCSAFTAAARATVGTS